MNLRPSALVGDMKQVPEDLNEFVRWYFDGGIKLLPPQDGILFQRRPGTEAVSVVLYRDKSFQVELIIFGPGTEIPEHRHDHIDSVEVMVSGALDLFVSGQKCVYAREPRENGVSRDALKFMPITSDSYHNGQASKYGGCFLSVQKWKGMNPSHVGIEWQDRSDNAF